jgi:hypothetical protein
MRRPRGLHAIVLFLLSVLIALGWHWYARTPHLHPNIATLTRTLEPLYVVERPTDITTGPTRARFITAILCAVAGVGLTWVSIARRWRTVICLTLGVISVLAINVSVARIPQGHQGLLEPFSRRGLEYYPDVRLVRDDPIGFIERYPTLGRRLALHPGTHPPGAVLFLYFGGKAIDAVWTSPPGPTQPSSPLGFLFGEPPASPAHTVGMSIDAACWLAIVTCALAVVPAYWIARQVGGAATARRALPLFLVAPSLVTFGATSMDGVFLTFMLVALGSGLAAMRRWSVTWTLLAGATLWVSTFLTYTSVVVPVVMGAYALALTITRPWRGGQMLLRCIGVGIAFIVCQALAQWLLHYDFQACVRAAIHRDEAAMGSGYETWERYKIVTLSNLLAVLLGSGVATTALAAWSVVLPSRRRLYAFAVATVSSLVVLCASTLFTLEAERVLLVFAPLLLIASTRVLKGGLAYLIAIVLLIGQALWIEVNYRTYW